MSLFNIKITGTTYSVCIKKDRKEYLEYHRKYVFQDNIDDLL